ncbi:MAG: hypothetical protein U0002_08400 [Thermoanaerobaculia bacterium]
MRRTHLKGRANIHKRVLIQVGAFNLGLVLPKRLGAGTPRGLAARFIALLATLLDSLGLLHRHHTAPACLEVEPLPQLPLPARLLMGLGHGACAAGC